MYPFLKHLSSLMPKASCNQKGEAARPHPCVESIMEPALYYTFLCVRVQVLRGCASEKQVRSMTTRYHLGFYKTRLKASNVVSPSPSLHLALLFLASLPSMISIFAQEAGISLPCHLLTATRLSHLGSLSFPHWCLLLPSQSTCVPLWCSCP